jgi:hypothetical protein
VSWSNYTKTAKRVLGVTSAAPSTAIPDPRTQYTAVTQLGFTDIFCSISFPLFSPGQGGHFSQDQPEKH